MLYALYATDNGHYLSTQPIVKFRTAGSGALPSPASPSCTFEKIGSLSKSSVNLVTMGKILRKLGDYGKSFFFPTINKPAQSNLEASHTSLLLHIYIGKGYIFGNFLAYEP
jgi:hypothetical protein